jgi:hypothetical protein
MICIFAISAWFFTTMPGSTQSLSMTPKKRGLIVTSLCGPIAPDATAFFAMLRKTGSAVS